MTDLGLWYSYLILGDSGVLALRLKGFLSGIPHAKKILRKVCEYPLTLIYSLAVHLRCLTNI